MNTYNFQSIEEKWQAKWAESNIYRSEIDSTKPKFYALDMFPYPSGAGLHVGHPLGYIASDIVSRYKRLNGYNVLHPMGFDAFIFPFNRGEGFSYITLVNDIYISFNFENRNQRVNAFSFICFFIIPRFK